MHVPSQLGAVQPLYTSFSLSNMTCIKLLSSVGLFGHCNLSNAICCFLTFSNLSTFPITKTELSLIAVAAITGARRPCVIRSIATGSEVSTTKPKIKSAQIGGYNVTQKPHHPFRPTCLYSTVCFGCAGEPSANITSFTRRQRKCIHRRFYI